LKTIAAANTQALSVVIPAKAGIHEEFTAQLDSGMRRNDDRWRFAMTIAVVSARTYEKQCHSP
jgi:hypothetical protein